MFWAIFLLGAVSVFADNLVPLRTPTFDRSTLTKGSSFQLLNPSQFHMQQSYTMSYSTSSYGSQSSGVYLNTLSYKFGIPLTLSADIGAYNLFSASGDYKSYSKDQTGSAPQFLFPRIGLEYKPTDNLLFSLEWINLTDAYKAYGYPSFYSSGWRRTHLNSDLW